MTPARLAAAFVLYGLAAIAFLAINVPPYQNPDETAHFWRAAQLAEGGLVGSRFSLRKPDGSQRLVAGGPVDVGLFWSFYPFEAVGYHPETRVTAAMWGRGFRWNGTQAMVVFSNTAVDPPLFYVPAAIGVLIARATRMSVLNTLVMSRMLTGAAAVAVGAAAIACAGGAAVWLFAILTLPMSLSLIASTSQEALMLAFSGMAGAFLVRALQWPSDGDRKALATLAVSLMLVATARPPYGALAVLPLAVTRLPLRWRVMAATAVVAGVAAWSGIASATALTNIGEDAGADPAAQIGVLFHDPLLLAHATWNALTQYWPGYLEQFVGRLSLFDVVLPPAYHRAAWAILVIAALGTMAGLRGERIGIGSRLVIATGLLLSVAGLFAIEYVTWTVPGRTIVEGVEGRYFLPLALVGGALLPALGDARWARLHHVLVWIVAGFPVISLAVVMRAVVLRYYLQ